MQTTSLLLYWETQEYYGDKNTHKGYYYYLLLRITPVASSLLKEAGKGYMQWDEERRDMVLVEQLILANNLWLN